MIASNQIERYIGINKEKATQSEDELAFWGNNPPREIIVATGSIRKALMLVAQINNFTFKVYENGQEIEISDPLNLQGYFERNIRNGNGALQQKTFLGYLRGVKLFAEPSQGETDSNEDPYQEAVNKVWDLHNKYSGENILIISTDTVEITDQTESPLGKPENELNFPDKNSFYTDEFFDETKYNKAVTAYLESFKQRFYVAGGEILHTNAVAILDAFTGTVIQLNQKLLELEIIIDEQKLAVARPQQDAGGGAMSQQLISWDDSEVIKTYFDDFTKDVLDEIEDLPMRMALFCQISGMPYAIIELLRLAQEEVNEINEVMNRIVIGGNDY